MLTKESKFLTAAIAEREKELQDITDSLIEPRPGSVREKMDELRAFALSRLGKIRELLRTRDDIAMLHEMLAEQLGSITLKPVIEDGKRLYLAQGKVDFLGEEAYLRTGGARGQNRTGYARLFRAALYQ